MASAELLKVTHGVDDRVKDVDERVQEVGGDVQDVGKRMQGIDSNVKDMTDKVQGVDDKVQDVHDEVQAIDNKLNKVNRSSSHYFPFFVRYTQTSSQDTSSETVFFDGSRLQIPPPPITLHANPVITAQLNGSFKAVYSTNGNPMVPSCGCMAYVRPFDPLSYHIF
jgi:uncharacterized protein YoxC